MLDSLLTVVKGAPDLSFGQPWWLVACLGVVPLVWLWRRLRPAVATTFGNRGKIRSVGWPMLLCTAALAGFWFCLCIARARPQLAETGYAPTYQAREFQILIDDSGSMFMTDVNDAETGKTVKAWEKKIYEWQLQLFRDHPDLFPEAPKSPDEQTRFGGFRDDDQDAITRFSLARYGAFRFVQSRLQQSEEAKLLHKAKQGDRVGMAPFSDEVQGGVPITGTLRNVLGEIANLLNVQSGGGTNFQGPDPESGDFHLGAFQYCIDQFNNPRLSKGGIKTKVMIFISDGEASISPKRHAELTAQMKNRKPGEPPIHAFFFVCGGQSQTDSASNGDVGRLLQEINPPEWQAKDYIFWAASSKQMDTAFDTINRLEASTVEGEPFPRKRDVSFEFVLLSLIFGTLWLAGAETLRLGT